jgi:Leucine-rich repeat (LRR) protein
MWKFKEFDEWIKDGRPINKYVIKLDISYSNIKTLGNLENLINLKKLYCDDNQLSSLEEIENLVNLEKLVCNKNQLTSLKGIENLINLKDLSCVNNQLTSLEGIENLINLENLSCGCNQLTSLEEIENLNNLKGLRCYNNKLTSLEGIEILVKLIKNKKQMKNNTMYDFMKITLYNFIDSDDYIELNDLFGNLLWCTNNNKIDKYIEEIEQMIITLNCFQQYVLK